MFFILFLCYVTVGLAALQFNSPSVTLLNIILTYFMFNFYLQNPPHTTSTPSPIHPLNLSVGGGHVFGDPFPNTRQATKVARETSVFFCFCFFCFFVFVFLFFFTKVRQHSLKSGEVRLGIHQLVEGRLQLTRG